MSEMFSFACLPVSLKKDKQTYVSGTTQPWEIIVLLPTGSEERGVLGVGSTFVAILPKI